MQAYWFVCPAIVAKHLWCEQLVKEVQLTGNCYPQICVFLVLMSNSYSESIVDRPCSLTPPIPITISSSQSPVVSVTPVRCNDTANFITIEVQVCYIFLKHNIFRVKAKESFVIWIIEEICLENRQLVSSTQLSKTLSLSLCTQRECKMALGK